MDKNLLLDRRRLLVGSGALALAPLFPAWAQSGHPTGHGGHSRGSGPMAGRNSGGTLSEIGRAHV